MFYSKDILFDKAYMFFWKLNFLNLLLNSRRYLFHVLYKSKMGNLKNNVVFNYGLAKDTSL